MAPQLKQGHVTSTSSTWLPFRRASRYSNHDTYESFQTNQIWNTEDHVTLVTTQRHREKHKFCASCLLRASRLSTLNFLATPLAILLMCLMISSMLGSVSGTGALLPSSNIMGSALDLSELEKKSLFQTLMPSRCSVNCVSSKLRPVCGTDDVTYSSRCELKRAKKCEKKRMLKVKHKGRCMGDQMTSGKCQQDLQDALRIAEKQNPSVLIPKCNSDGTYKEVQCHKSTGYCWCVTRDGRHIPGSSRKGTKKLKCKAVKKQNSRVTRKVKKKRGCMSRDRQSFNANLIKNFKAEYDRAVTGKPPETDENGDEIGSEKAIVMWKYNELDVNKDGKLKFKEIRKFGRMVRKLIEPRKCGKGFLKHCDSKKDRTIDKKEWTLCLGVDIKTSNGESTDSNPEPPRNDLLLHTSSLLQGPNMPVLTSRPSPGSQSQRQESNKDEARTCHEQREAALLDHAQHPDAKHYIPKCTAAGLWEKAQCHTALCWCVQESDGQSIPWTATTDTTPNCTFENERDMKGCPFLEKRRFLVDLVGDLTKEWEESTREKDNTTHLSQDSRLPEREKVARWKLKSLDANENGVLERKEWRPLRKVTLKNKHYPRKCRRNFLRYCDADNNKKISADEWIDCLGLSNTSSSNLPMNPKRKGKNPFMDQLRPSESW